RAVVGVLLSFFQTGGIGTGGETMVPVGETVVGG
ncbi:MAG: hypothetical protein G01um101438_646, partial [Parcubacteria group bacterium Gr01-1014_38]